MLASHGWFHEASPCCSSWTTQSVDDPFICAPYNALDLSDAGSCETEQLVHEDVSGAAGAQGAMISHPAILEGFCRMALLHVLINALAAYTGAVTFIWQLDCQNTIAKLSTKACQPSMHTAFAESTQLGVHPSVKAKDEDSAQGANKFNQSGIAVLAPNLHMHSGRQRTGVMSSGQLLPAVGQTALTAIVHGLLSQLYSSWQHTITTYNIQLIGTDKAFLLTLVCSTYGVT